MPITIHKLNVSARLRTGACVIALAAMASPAMAAGECGADGAGADTIICTGTSFPNGITYAGSDGFNLILNEPTMTVLKGTATDGVNLNGTTANDLTVTAASLASINGGTGTAVTVSNGGDGKAAFVLGAGTLTSAGTNTVLVTHGSGAGDSIITMTGGTATNTAGVSSTTLNAQVTGSATGNATILMSGGTVKTNGNSASVAMRAAISNAASPGNASVTMTGGAMTGAGIGAQAVTNGSGLAQVTLDSASIATTGGGGAVATNSGTGNAVIDVTNSGVGSGLIFTASALSASADSGAATVTVTNSTITAKGSSGGGIVAASNSGNASVSMTGGSVSNTASGGVGLRATAGGAGNATATLNGGTVATSGATLAYGVYALTNGTGTATAVMNGGTITISGTTGTGLRAQSGNGLSVIRMTDGTVTGGSLVSSILATNNNAGTGTYDISITGGTVNGGNLAAVQGYSTAPGGVISIGADAIINAKNGTSGVAITTTGAGAAGGTITTAGTITGGIKFQPGTTNTLNITGGSLAGDIAGGGSDTLNFDLGSSGFAYDAAYNITGVTGLAMKSGTVTLANTATIDAVTVTGGTLVLTGAVNTPAFALNGGTLSVSNDANLGTDAGALDFNGGILQVTGTAMTGLTRAFTWGANGGGFDIADAGNVFTVSQALAGGALTKQGAGTLVLTGSSTVTGTTIAAGTLQVGNGGTTGSITGNVTDNGALVFRRADAITFAGVVSGSGSVGQMGTGNATLAGVNTYGGGTIIGSGTMTGSATSFGSGAIADNGALVIDQPADAAFANAINGNGSFTKTGAGRLNYTGTGLLTGPTTVSAGTLAVNGSLAASAVTVQGGATLGGNGTMGATAIQPGGIIAPGNSIGTLHVNGAYVQAAGADYQIQIDPNSSAADLITASGAATLQSGARLTVTSAQPGPYRLGTQYTVLHADGGVSGTYALDGGTLPASPYLGLRDSYDANNVYLSVVRTGDPAAAAQTGNQAQTATGVASLPGAGDVSTAVLNTPDAAATRNAFDQLSGAAIASANSMMIAGSMLVRDTTFDRLRDVFCTGPGCVAVADRPTLWAQGFGGWNRIYGDGNAAGISQTTGGFLVGTDVAVQDWRMGVFGGYGRSDFSTQGAQGSSDAYHLGAYGGTSWGALGLRLGASHSWNGLATRRLVAFDNFANDLRATYKADTTQLFGELGQRIMLDDVVVEPFANLAYLNLHTDGFHETGGPAALASRASTLEDTFTTLGARPSTGIALGDTALVARGMIGWRHAFGDMRPASVVSFDGGSAFTVAGAPIAQDAGVVEAGFDVSLSGTAALALTYGGQFSSRETDHSLRGTVAVTF